MSIARSEGNSTPPDAHEAAAPQRGEYVRLRCGLVGLFAWSYENPVTRPGYEDRAAVTVGNETWCANLADLQPVSLGPANSVRSLTNL